MRYAILLSLFLAGCNTVDGVNAGLNVIDVASKLGIDSDTNGYYTKNTKPEQKICEYRTGPNSTAWRPCK